MPKSQSPSSPKSRAFIAHLRAVMGRLLAVKLGLSPSTVPLDVKTFEIRRHGRMREAEPATKGVFARCLHADDAPRRDYIAHTREYRRLQGKRKGGLAILPNPKIAAFAHPPRRPAFAR